MIGHNRVSTLVKIESCGDIKFYIIDTPTFGHGGDIEAIAFNQLKAESIGKLAFKEYDVDFNDRAAKVVELIPNSSAELVAHGFSFYSPYWRDVFDHYADNLNDIDSSHDGDSPSP